MDEMAEFAGPIWYDTDRQASERHSSRISISKSSTLLYRCLIALIGLIITPFVSSAQVPQPSQSGSDDNYTLQLNANMVILSATVLDRHNALVSGLQKGDFQVYEDGALQQIKNFSHEDIPVTVGILVDNSGSMGPKRRDVIAAAMAFARSSNPEDQMFVVNFNDHVSFGLPANMPFTDKQDQLQVALSGITSIGETSLYDGLAVALEHLKQGTRDKKVLILISDGGDNASKHSLAQIIDMAKHSATIIYAIGIFDEQDGDQNPGVLRRFAKETGGEAFFPESPRDITSICEGIARDIRTQYTLTYVPTIASQDGKYRTIEVKARARDRGRLSVRTRTGYSVPLTLPAAAAKALDHDTHN
ncbi:MAG: VWA domain-containing protein [Terracidiphilus sp.]|jgi:VWFA-related protein